MDANQLLRALLMAAPQFQGGHSDVGAEIAETLCVPFPLTMPSLRAAAIDSGFLPYDLWPWLQTLDEQHRDTLSQGSSNVIRPPHAKDPADV